MVSDVLGKAVQRLNRNSKNYEKAIELAYTNGKGYTVCLYSTNLGFEMLVRVACLFEAGGVPLPRHRAVTIRPEHMGVLSLCEGHDRELRRSVRSAYLRSVHTGDDVLPALRDAVVLWIGDRKMTITGFEQDPVTRSIVGQSWYIEYEPDVNDRRT
jgi:hypothetical protein